MQALDALGEFGFTGKGNIVQLRLETLLEFWKGVIVELAASLFFLGE
jgi:hypothetical protein